MNRTDTTGLDDDGCGAFDEIFCEGSVILQSGIYNDPFTLGPAPAGMINAPCDLFSSMSGVCTISDQAYLALTGGVPAAIGQALATPGACIGLGSGICIVAQFGGVVGSLQDASCQCPEINWEVVLITLTGSFKIGVWVVANAPSIIFSSHGRRGVKDTGVENERLQQYPNVEPCTALAQMMDAAKAPGDTQLVKKIEQTQKAYGCRNTQKEGDAARWLTFQQTQSGTSLTL